MVPNLDEAYSVLIGGKWTEIRSATPSDLQGWTVLEMPSNFMRINVRTDAITAVRYRTLPTVKEQLINTPWAVS